MKPWMLISQEEMLVPRPVEDFDNLENSFKEDGIVSTYFGVFYNTV